VPCTGNESSEPATTVEIYLSVSRVHTRYYYASTPMYIKPDQGVGHAIQHCGTHRDTHGLCEWAFSVVIISVRETTVTLEYELAAVKVKYSGVAAEA
jgi:hypothetical protein